MSRATAYRLQQRMLALDAKNGSEAFRTWGCYPDSAWMGGLFYYNPDDPALFVEKRFGLGRSLNWSHPQAGLFLMGMVLTLVLSLLLVFLQH